MNNTDYSGPLVEARNLSRSYRIGAQSIHALRDVSLTVNRGEILCIMGASGAGKSTLLGVLGGLDRPTTGEVLFKGERLYGLPTARRNRIRALEVGFVFQSYHLLPELDIVENVMLPARSQFGFLGRHAQHRRRAMDLLARIGLHDRAEHKPLELSGGEQQRVAIARALMNEPELVLADEPTGNLDSATGRRVLDDLFSLTGDRKRTLIVVTHNESIADLCTRGIRMKDGSLVGAPAA